MIVDTHCHVSDRWYEPDDVLLSQMDRCGVERAWLVQMLGNYDNEYQADACRRHPDRFVNIVGIDWTRDDGAARLQQAADDGARGVRLRPGSRSPGADPLAIWRCAAQCGLIVSCGGTSAQFSDPEFAKLAAAFPDLPIVLEHLGGLARPDVGDLAVAMPAIASLSAKPSIRLKLPGLGQMMPKAALASPPVEASAAAATPIGAMLASFGPERLMWSSDFPVVSSREGYGNALAWIAAVVRPDAWASIAGENANNLMAKP